MEIKISIIIPCYNGFRYMERCINSLCNQTYRNFEVIIVDDCSTDGSVNEIKGLINKINFDLKIIENSINKGPGYSRKVGIQSSIGEFVCFCDTDDWYEERFLEKMLKTVLETESDIVFCDCYYVNENQKNESKWYEPIKIMNSKKEIIAFSYGSLCISMIKRELFDGIDFPELYHGEDAALIPVIISKGENITIIKEPLYNYLMRNDSASNLFDRKAFDSANCVFRYIKYNLSKDFSDEVEFIGIKGILYSGCLNAIKCGISMSEISKVVQAFKDDYPNYKDNIYLKRYNKFKKIFIKMIDHNNYFAAKMFSILHTKFINR